MTTPPRRCFSDFQPAWNQSNRGQCEKAFCVSSCLTGLDTGRAQAGDAPGRFRDFVQQLGAELRLRAPAGCLLDAGGCLNFHCALVGLAAQGAGL